MGGRRISVVVIETRLKCGILFLQLNHYSIDTYLNIINKKLQPGVLSILSSFRFEVYHLESRSGNVRDEDVEAQFQALNRFVLP